jgi:hypothetical protein
MKENKIAIIKNGIVENVIIASVEFGNSLPDLTIDVTDIEVSIGWIHNVDDTFSSPDSLLTPEEILVKKLEDEKNWADAELKASDYMAPITDHQYYYAYVVYRQQLREYLVATEFPNGVRPILDKTIKNSLTKYQFMSRFTATERITMEGASAQSPELADWITLFKLTEEINLGDPNTIGGVTMLETVGIIGVGRASEILS